MLSFRSAISVCLVCKFVIAFHVTLIFPIRSSSKVAVRFGFNDGDSAARVERGTFLGAAPGLSALC